MNAAVQAYLYISLLIIWTTLRTRNKYFGELKNCVASFLVDDVQITAIYSATRNLWAFEEAKLTVISYIAVTVISLV